MGMMGDKPREKALSLGISSLSDTELVALLLNTGTKEENVMELSSRLLLEKGGLRGIFLNGSDLEGFHGIGKAKKCRLLAIQEIMKRLPLEILEPIKTSLDAFKKAQNYFMDLDYEKIVVLYLSYDRKLKRLEEVVSFSLKEVDLPLKNIIKQAFLASAKGVILLHNHPSKRISPSQEDFFSTGKAYKALQMADLCLMDSIIVGENEYYSFRDHKMGPYAV